MDGGLDQARSLRDVFASMSHGSGDPAAALAQAGHADLPGHLVTEAIISYADAAPVEVAEHLQPFVVANSAVPAADGHPYPVADLPDGFSLLTSAPVPVDHDPGHDLHDPAHDPYDVHLDDHQHSLLDDGLHDGPHDGLHDGGLHDAIHGPVHDPLHDGFHDDLHAAAARTGTDHDLHRPDTAPGDLWFGHGQAAALDPHPLGGPLGSADDTGQHFADHLAGGGHPDPWLAGTGEAGGSGAVVPEHADALTLWDPQAETGHDAGHDLVEHPAEHPPLPVEDQGPHDLPDPGHA